MNLTDKDIAKFKALYKAKTGIELDNNEARRQLSLLVRQMEIVYQPITKKQFEDFTEREKAKEQP